MHPAVIEIVSEFPEQDINLSDAGYEVKLPRVGQVFNEMTMVFRDCLDDPKTIILECQVHLSHSVNIDGLANDYLEVLSKVLAEVNVFIVKYEPFCLAIWGYISEETAEEAECSMKERIENATISFLHMLLVAATLVGKIYMPDKNNIFWYQNITPVDLVDLTLLGHVPPKDANQ